MDNGDVKGPEDFEAYSSHVSNHARKMGFFTSEYAMSCEYGLRKQIIACAREGKNTAKVTIGFLYDAILDKVLFSSEEQICANDPVGRAVFLSKLGELEKILKKLPLEKEASLSFPDKLALKTG